jgi:starch synthase
LLSVVVDALPGLGATFVLQGRGQRYYEDQWLALAVRHPEAVGMKLGDDPNLAHAVTAGADLFVMPARQDPSGVQAMVSLRYGTVPLVRAAGALADTVRNYDARSGDGNGFVFDEYSAQALLDTLRWAVDVFGDAGAWRHLQAAGMGADHSWDESAKHYARLYERAATQRVWQ